MTSCLDVAASSYLLAIAEQAPADLAGGLRELEQRSLTRVSKFMTLED